MPASDLLLEPWHDFYVVIGSSAAALTGLTFVVIALAADAQMVRMQGLRAFITPMVVHFCSAVGISALMCVPGHTRLSFAACVVVVGVAGAIYSVLTARRMYALRPEYVAVAADWIWNVMLPLITYGTLLVAARLAPQPVALYLVGAVTLMQLFIGIHNAWDIAVWITAERPSVRAQRDVGATAAVPAASTSTSVEPVIPAAPADRTDPQT